MKAAEAQQVTTLLYMIAMISSWNFGPLVLFNVKESNTLTTRHHCPSGKDVMSQAFNPKVNTPLFATTANPLQLNHSPRAKILAFNL